MYSSKIRHGPPLKTTFDWRNATGGGGDRVVSCDVSSGTGTRPGLGIERNLASWKALAKGYKSLSIAEFSFALSRSWRRKERTLRRLLKSSLREEVTTAKLADTATPRHDNDTLGARPGGSRPENTPRVLRRWREQKTRRVMRRRPQVDAAPAGPSRRKDTSLYWSGVHDNADARAPHSRMIPS